MKTAQITRMLHAFWEEQDGVAAIEYALLTTLIFGAIVVPQGLLGDSVTTFYDDIAAKVPDVVS